MPQKKPKLGQNFLVDDAARHRIADALGDISTRTVIEIGPGHGAITSILATPPRTPHRHRARPRRSPPSLSFQFRATSPTSTILQQPTSSTPTSSLIPPANTVDVIGNLPYYITSDILLHLFAAARAGLLPRAVLMMQREVADRIAATPGVRDYGLLSATTQLHAHVENLFTLPPSAFSPPPEVYSTVLRLDFAPRFAELRVDPDGFDRFLRASFAQKRKTLANNLRSAGYPPQRSSARGRRSSRAGPR